jgi:CRISPR system Cascade subunit CasD
VVGLLAAALGRPRNADISDLMQFQMAVRIDRGGALRRDFQTAGGGKLPDGRDYGVAKANSGKPATVTSSRYYLADADFRVALGSDNVALLRSISVALVDPAWPLYLGRKAFVPNADLFQRIREGVPVLECLRAEPWFFRSLAERRRREGQPMLRVVVEVEETDNADDVRTDVTNSFATREFQLRHVKTEWITLTPELWKEDVTCI